MADPGFGTSPYILPNMFGSPGQALDNYARGVERNNERQYEMNWRQQRQAEADDWKKLQLIQELTDLSKHKTGSDVADAVGNHLMSDIFQRYTMAAKTMSPLQLQASIQKDMSGIVGGMDAIKNDLLETDKQMSQMKQLYPELNHAQLYDDVRKDIVTRRLNNEAKDFKNPMEIEPSKIDLTNPEFLSNYVAGDKAIKDYFANPQGVDDTFVFKGTNYANTKYKGKITPWRKPNYDASQLKEGFLPSKAGEPKLDFRSTTIPTEALPSSNGKPFEVIEEDVYRNSGLNGMSQLQLINATKKKFPEYDKFNQEEKDLAKRNVYLEYAKNFDKTDFYPVDRSNPSAAMIKVWTGGSGSGSGGDQSIINDIYGRIRDKVSGNYSNGGKGTRFNSLANDEQEVVKKAIDNAGFDLEEGGRNIFLIENEGKMKIYRTDAEGRPNVIKENEIAELPYIGTNIGKQANVKGKVETVRQGNQQPAPKQTPKKNDPLGLGL
jgi:hypothetical protein